MVLITIVTGAYKPTYNWGASHCIYYLHLTGILEIPPRLASFQSHPPGVVPSGTNSLTIPLDTYHNQFTHFVVYTRSVAYEQTTPVGGQLNGATIQDPGSNTSFEKSNIAVSPCIIDSPPRVHFVGSI